MFIEAEQPTSNIIKMEGTTFAVKHFGQTSSYLVTMLIHGSKYNETSYTM